MVTLAVRTWRTDGTTIVACRLANDADEPRVALLDSRLDGPTHVAAAYRSEEATLRVSVPANGTVGAGFATPADPVDGPAVELAGERPPTPPHADTVLDGLSEPRPPHEAVVANDRQRPTDHQHQPTDDEPEAECLPSGAADDRVDAADRSAESAAVTSALNAIERRIDRLEAVATATTVPEAADALAREGSLDSVRHLDAQVRTDRAHLTALADRALTLAGRAEAAEPRIETLDRLS